MSAFLNERARENVVPDIGILGAGRDKCFGLPKKMCRAGEPPEDLADMKVEAQVECENLFCHPMCTENTLTCDVEFKGPFRNHSDPLYATALCRQIIAFACTKNECCKAKSKPEDHSPLEDWVERAAYGDGGMTPLVPLPYCRGINSLNKQAADYKCAMCKKYLSIRVEALSALEGCERLYAPIAPGEDPEIRDEEEKPDPPPGEEEGMKSLMARCRALRTEIVSKVQELAPNSKICECAGCCKPSSADDAVCFLPSNHWVNYGVPEIP